MIDEHFEIISLDLQSMNLPTTFTNIFIVSWKLLCEANFRLIIAMPIQKAILHQLELVQSALYFQALFLFNIIIISISV